MTRFETLLEVYRQDELADAELQEFLDLLAAQSSAMDTHLSELLLDDLRQNKFAGLTDQAMRERMLARVLLQNRQAGTPNPTLQPDPTLQSDPTLQTGRMPVLTSIPKSSLRSLVRKIAAAAILILLAGSVYLWLNHRAANALATQTAPLRNNDIAPGGDKATLTLADGTTIDLDSANSGRLTRQGGTSVVKVKNGQLLYEAADDGSPGSPASTVAYNMIMTPRGGRYQVFLPDGSKVILNSASSLRYPTAFTQAARSVQLTGEGYFEIVQNPAKPFTVEVNGMQVHVLGTHFDIMAYGDEATVNTALIEGAVQVQEHGQARTLKPGQEAVLDKNAKSFFIREADTDKVLAWTTGFFKFDHSDLRSIMREIARWYDIAIIYETTDNNETYGGRIRRDRNLSVLVKFLESNGIHHFRIDGKKLIVLP